MPTVSIAVLILPTTLGHAQSPRKTIPLDQSWRFLHADAASAQSPTFDDSTWRTLDVPHDWSIEGAFDEHAPTGGAGGFLAAGVGWYRKHFTLPASDAGRRVWVEFDGVMANSDVWINGTPLGHRPNGYVGFRYDLTPHLHFGANAANVLAVRVDDSAQPASRWYAGAGIYRHVRLMVSDPLHLQPDTTFVTTPAVTDTSADALVQTTIANDAAQDKSGVRVQVTLLAPDGQPVAMAETPPQTIAAGKSAEYHLPLTVSHPTRWDITTTNAALYRAVVRVVDGRQTGPAGQPADQESVPFGIREFHFDAATGFWLNGRNLKIKGVCLHQDAGALGVAVPLNVWESRLRALKSVGCNAIRRAHGPPDPVFLDLCDRMGFLVMDESFDVWTVGKEPYDYHIYFTDWSATDCRDTVRRDRNHPSVILYSAGNEIRDTPNAVKAKATLAALLAVFHAEDPTRPVTQALFRPNASHDYEDGLADMLDVVGQNYRENELIAAHAAKPTRKIIGTENGHDRRAWLAVRDNPAYSGQFLWTGFDYLGESRAWPTVGSSSGLFDRTGEPRPIAWERQSWWSNTPMVKIVRRVAPARATPADPGFAPLQARVGAQTDWSPANRTPHNETVEAYSNALQVELFLNDRSLGVKSLPADAAPRVWQVPFTPGTLRAVARNAAGVEVARDELRTAGPPAQVQLTVDRETLAPDYDSVAFVHATIVDAQGITLPDTADAITFHVAGPGAIVAVDNGDNASHEPFQATTRHAFGGKCLAIVRATAGAGTITVTAEATGLAEGRVTVRAQATGTSTLPAPRPALKGRSERPSANRPSEPKEVTPRAGIANSSARRAGWPKASQTDPSGPGKGLGQSSPVTLSQDAATYTLANGLVTARIDKHSGNLLSLRYGTVETLEGGRSPGYWSHTPAGAAKVVDAVTIDPSANGGERAEISIRGDANGKALGSGPGGSVIADIEIRYALERGTSGVYTYSILTHRPEYPATGIGEARFAAKLNDRIFDWMTVDARRNRLMLTAEDWDRGTRLNMKEARRITTGVMKGQVEHKYDYSAVQFDTPAFGWSSTTQKVGFWVVNPTVEYLSGGATKLELTTHRDATFTDSLTAPAPPVLLNYWRGSHYGGSDCSIAAGEAWTKVVGPFLLYCNSGATPDAMWHDALARAAREAKTWPYAWVPSGVDYPHASERGTVTGRITLQDTQAKSNNLPNLRVGLAHADNVPPSGGRGLENNHVDWQTDAKFYEFWTRASADGRFAIPSIRPGTYTLHAISDAVLGEYAHADVTVAAGQTVDLGSLTWTPVRYGKQIWEIGVPDRTSGEFRHGDAYNQWGLYFQYPTDFPHDVDYTVGASDARKDWNYAQVPRSIDGGGNGTATTWTVTFDLPAALTGNATLRLGLASTSARHIDVGVNGQAAGTVGPLADTAGIRRDSDRGYWRERIVSFPASLLKAGTNTLTLAIPAGNVMSGVEYDYLRLEVAAP